ncbi:MAG: DMT family transporter, partial [Reyranella sp.]
MTVSTLAFTVNDGLVKLVSEAGVPFGQILFVRGLAGSILVCTLLVATGAHRALRRLADRFVVWRTMTEVAATLAYLTALFRMPIATATTLQQAVPLAATAGAAIFLREAVGWRRWTAIAIGFLGVVIVVRPGLGGFDASSAFVLLAVLFIATRDLITRVLDPAIPTILVTAAASVAITLTGGVISLGETWIALSAGNLWMLALASVCLVAGYYSVILALRVGEMSVVAPFRYVVIVWALLFGMLVWHETPDALTMIGTALIIGTGVYTFYRERYLERQGRPVPPLTMPVVSAPP